MSFTGSNLQNVSSKMYADVLGHGFAPGTPIIIYPLNEAPSGTMNQQWRIVPMPSGKNLFTIQSVLTGLYAVVDGRPDVNQGIVTGVVAMPWEINTIGGPTSHSVTISVPNSDLFWNVPSDVLLTKIILSKQNNGASQMWTPKATLPSL
ncbi:ricin B lectin domain-containing protein [Collybia nuda]|uniref:Ricin B lectin domain-containing protein n=1 Tax=Collybia nuda TaxID=64659 RepID=A0A9P6CGN2_9AGAR|nr:ricin B lectin domain-containing protein [Collybia nuda]